jgi:holo-[acyl-carrier protein] synthase
VSRSGLGIDLVPIARIQSLLSKHPQAAERIFGPEELAQANALGAARRAEFLAGRFAVKEALCKALGGPRGVDPRDIECLRGADGAPALTLTGTAASALSRNDQLPLVSISHDGGFAIAVVQL